MMFINITIEIGATRRDIRIDADQKIIEGLSVLRQSGKLPMGANPDYFRSRLNQTLASANKTFFEENIFDGDIITAI
jgi:hypothetical protein